MSDHIRQIIATHIFPKPMDDLPPLDAALRDMGIDQIEAAYISVELEDAYNIRFNDPEIFGWTYVEDIVRSVEEKRRD